MVRNMLLCLLGLVYSVYVSGQTNSYAHLFPAKTALPKHKMPAETKVLRVLVSSPGIGKMLPFQLEKEIVYDTASRIIKDITYEHERSLFGRSVSKDEIEYTYDRQGNLINYLRKADYGGFTKEIGYEYDQQGKMVKVLLYKPNGTVEALEGDGSIPFYRQRLQYTPQPLLVYDSMQNADYAKRELLKVYSAKNALTYALIPNGYEIKELATSGRIISERRVIFNEQKQVTQITSSNELSHGNKYITIVNLLYDKAGNVIEQAVSDGKGKPVLKYSHVYNKEKGYLEQTVWSVKKDQTVKVIKYEYEFYNL